MNYGGIKGTIITADANDKINITENGVIITDKAGVIQGVFAAARIPKCGYREFRQPNNNHLVLRHASSCAAVSYAGAWYGSAAYAMAL